MKILFRVWNWVLKSFYFPFETNMLLNSVEPEAIMLIIMKKTKRLSIWSIPLASRNLLTSEADSVETSEITGKNFYLKFRLLWRH